jgi:2-C-methyl-D-erythritol 4-phosphate cytidylyltransferase
MCKVTAIVLAAGQGRRMNSSVAKQYLMLRDKPVIYYSLKAFEASNVDEIILVTGEGQVDYCRKEIIERYQIKKVAKILEGGTQRYDSVFKALVKAESTGYVLIHDGARPFITVKLIDMMIDCVKEYKACIIGMPVKETIKVVDETGVIIATPNRDALWTAQTPQAFDYSLIKKAYDLFYQEKDRKSTSITDDAMLYENYCKQPVKMLNGDYNNIKLTTPEDLILAEQILNHMN